jgi:capsular exopolysaccharide synthesis family protein
VSYAVTQTMPRTYVTSTTLMVGESSATPNLSPNDQTTSQRIAAVYAGVVRRQPILQATIDTLQLPYSWQELRDRVLVSRAQDSQFIEIRVLDRDPERARATADEVARQMIIQSPTAESMQQLEQRRVFLKRQLDRLQANISAAEISIAERQQELESAGGARTVLAIQDSVDALQGKLTSWSSTYASLLTSYEGRSPNVLSVIDPAFVPTSFASPDVRGNVVFAALVGLLLALGTIFLLEYIMGDRLSAPDQVSTSLDLPVLASIPNVGRITDSTEHLVTLKRPQSPDAEAYRVLRTNVQFASRGREGLAILVTSPAGGEGKSVTAANLAISFARADRQTILVDADMRGPSVNTLFGIGNEHGLTSLLLSRQASGAAGGDASALAERLKRQVERMLVGTEIPTLSLLPTGHIPPVNPGELLASAEMGQVLAALKSAAEVVVVDSPPVDPVADTAILAGMGMGVILVTETGKTRRQEAVQAIEILRRADARILGVVLNRAPRRPDRLYRSRSQTEATRVQAPAHGA